MEKGKKDGKKKGFIAEFKKFITRGNVLDMAVGVIVGGAFTSIVTSLNQDILTPILGIFGGTDFSYLTVTLGSGENAPVLYYGNFITAIINFLITALVIFCLIKGINVIGEKVKKKEEAAPAAPTTRFHWKQSDVPIVLPISWKRRKPDREPETGEGSRTEEEEYEDSGKKGNLFSGVRGTGHDACGMRRSRREDAGRHTADTESGLQGSPGAA